MQNFRGFESNRRFPLLWLAFLAPLGGQGCVPPRVAVPHEVVPVAERMINPQNGSGQVFQSIAVRVGSTTVNVMLDSGSSGLRIQESALRRDDYTLTSTPSAASYGSGLTVSGHIAMAEVGIGNLQTEAPIPFQLIEATNGKMGDSPEQGAFDGLYGIMGTMPSGGSYAMNPLMALGSGVWIFNLAAPWEGGQGGSLILNPTASDLADFVKFPLAKETRVVAGDPPPSHTASGWDSASLAGCVKNLGTGHDFCQPTLMDSGAWNVHDAGSSPPASYAWSAGTNASLTISGAENGGSVTLPFVVGQRPGSDVQLPRTAGADVTNTGPFPFFFFQVLYDSNAGQLGMKRK